ncbi:MAG: hypothetical protein AAF715_06185 [Myxococcota bacterium]
MRLAREEGGEVTVVAIEGERVTLTALEPAAPGSRVVARGLGYVYRVKAHRSIRVGPHFEIHGRLFDLTREARRALVAALDRYTLDHNR